MASKNYSGTMYARAMRKEERIINKIDNRKNKTPEPTPLELNYETSADGTRTWRC